MKEDFAIIQILTEPSGGGAEIIGRELGIYLRQSGYNSHVIFFSNPKNIILNKSEIVLGDLNPRDLRNIFLLKKQIKYLKKRYHKLILHSHLTWPFYFTSFFNNSKQIKNIYTEHNTYNKRRNFPIIRGLERKIYSKYDFITCISNGTKLNLENWLKKDFNKNKCKVIYNGSRKFKYSYRKFDESKKINIISIGSLTHQKGFDIAIRSINICRDIINQYWIYGEGPEKYKLIALINKFNLGKIVKLKGYEDKIFDKNLNANLGLLTSRWEGFGMVATELLSAGIPLIASNVSGLNEVLKECKAAFLVNVNSEKEIAQEIYKAKDSFLLNKSIDRIAMQYSERFSFEKMTSEYEKIYCLLIKSFG